MSGEGYPGSPERKKDERYERASGGYLEMNTG
jgi:hypothetical protein